MSRVSCFLTQNVYLQKGGCKYLDRVTSLLPVYCVLYTAIRSRL